MNESAHYPYSTLNEAVLEAKDLSRYFTGGGEVLKILENLSFTVNSGQSVAILGASGSGKSTLMYLLGGLDRPNFGKVIFQGHNIFEWGEKALARWRCQKVGFVFQFHHLLPEFDALENTAMPARLAGMESDEAKALAEPILKRVGLSHRISHRPGALSGGEQQRVALARALVMNPDILLADEPTGNLDAKNATMVNELICQLVKERHLSAVVVTHNATLARMLDRRLELIQSTLEPWT